MTRPFLPAAMTAMAIAASTAAPALAAEQAPPRIVVSGQGEASVSPDMAILSLSVMRQADTARAALDANSAAMAEVTAALKQAGVAERDLQTSNFSVDPVYVYPKPDEPSQAPRIVGYQVVNTLAVRIRDIAKVGEILDRSVSLGVNQGGSISFTNDDPSQTTKAARVAAVKDAMDKARTLAEAAGAKLGPIVEISEQATMPQPMPYAMKAERADMSAAPIQAGENTYRVTVNVTFQLTP